MQKKILLEGDRGIALKLLDKGELGVTPVSGNRPIVIMLPGIMGSSIYNNGERVWLDFESINKL